MSTRVVTASGCDLLCCMCHVLVLAVASWQFLATVWHTDKGVNGCLINSSDGRFIYKLRCRCGTFNAALLH